MIYLLTNVLTTQDIPLDGTIFFDNTGQRDKATFIYLTFIRPKRKTERCKNSFLLSYVLALLRKPGNSIHKKKQREPNAVLSNKIISCYLPAFPVEIIGVPSQVSNNVY